MKKDEIILFYILVVDKLEFVKVNKHKISRYPINAALFVSG